MNFLTLHVAVSILASPKFSKLYVNFASDLMKHFVEYFGILYGKSRISHNIHGLLHISDDVKKYGPLDSFSAFRFENYMNKIKNFIHKSEKPLQQIIKRYNELNNLAGQYKYPENSNDVVVKKLHSKGPVIQNINVGKIIQYQQLKYKGLTINCKNKADRTLLLNCGKILKASNVIWDTILNQYFIIGKELKVIGNLYDQPFKSKFLNIHIVKEINEFKMHPVTKIEGKFWSMPLDSNEVVFPLIHF